VFYPFFDQANSSNNNTKDSVFGVFYELEYPHYLPYANLTL
jgi:hypothetical protein